MVQYYLEKLESEFELTFVSSSEVINMNPSIYPTDFRDLGLICRINSLSAIKAAGSGHIGTSFSVIDLLLGVRLFLFGDKIGQKMKNNVLFSSKGHDAPGIYAVMNVFQELDDSKLMNLRRLNGLPGHPEIGISTIPANTGSLGMGISKAKGLAYAKRMDSDNGYIVVILGDGELQEGQIWEALPGAVRDKLENLIVLVDGNKIQSDTWVHQTMPLGDLRMKVEGFGWKYHEIDGHSFESQQKAFKEIEKTPGPHFIYAHTIKGSGVSIFSHFPENGKFYKFHSGSPSDEEYLVAMDELTSKLNNENFEPRQIRVDHYNPKPRNRLFIQVWAEILEKWAESNKSIVVLDADLSYDTGTYKVRESFPERYIQCGIAEQDMVSTAGGLALFGKIPVIHSFSSFLTTRPAEQIFNNLTEDTTLHYVGFLAGILPSAPGHSHQAVTDVGIMQSMPNLKIFEPSCEKELKTVFENGIENSIVSTYLRLGSTELPPPYIEKFENLFIRKYGKDKLIITSGPAMTNIALQIARDSKFDISVVTKPALNEDYLKKEIDLVNQYNEVLVLENYLPTLSNFELLISHQSNLKDTTIHRIGITQIPKNGRTDEVLKFHGLDSQSILEKFGW